MIPNLEIPHSDKIGGAIIYNNELDTHTDTDMPLHDVFSTDHFRMFQFKVQSCPRGRAHDWTECPYAHPAEKARRRDPRKCHYSGTPCPDFRKGYCNKGDSCHFAHGVFECWLHPSRYRTQLCNDGTICRRKVCFFAHTAEQLRVFPHGSPERSPIRQNANTRYGAVLFNEVSVREIVSSMRNVQLDEVSSSQGFQMGPRVWSTLRPGCEEEPAMERVESGRDLRAKMYAKLTRENSIGRVNTGFSAPIPDIGWVSELVK